jgi:hypothetical protein
MAGDLIPSIESKDWSQIIHLLRNKTDKMKLTTLKITETPKDK